MKKLISFALVCSAFFAFQACNDGSTDAIESANESNEIKLDSPDNMQGQSAIPVSEEDSEFAVEAASGGMMDIRLGELAQQKASSQGVKDFGAMMVGDRAKVNDELKSLAGMKNITLPVAPGEDHMDHIKKLSGKSGKEFDKDYIKLMINEYQENVDDFEKVSTNSKDIDLQAFATKTLPTLRAHLDSAKAINGALK